MFVWQTRYQTSVIGLFSNVSLQEISYETAGKHSGLCLGVALSSVCNRRVRLTFQDVSRISLEDHD